MRNLWEAIRDFTAFAFFFFTVIIGWSIYTVAYNPDALNTARVEQELEQARAQYIAWFNEDPIKE